MRVLNEQEVHKLNSKLSAVQQQYLDEHIKENKKSKWLEALSVKKGLPINADMTIEEIQNSLDDWVLEDILDGGYGNRPYKCECGTSLRHQYIVYHTKEKKRYKLGSTCIQSYTLLDPKLIRDIQKGFHKVNLERDDILIKFDEEDFYELERLSYITDVPEAQEFIKQQEDIGLPLSEIQIKKLLKLNRDNHPVRPNRPTPSSYAEEIEIKEEGPLTYDKLMELHLPVLKLVGENEERLTPNGRNDLLVLRKYAKDLRDENETEIDYDIFKLRLRNLCRQLGINPDTL